MNKPMSVRGRRQQKVRQQRKMVAAVGDVRAWAGIERLEERRLLSGATPAVEMFAISPALFVENQGQWGDASIRFAHNGSGANVLMADAGPVLQLFQREETDAGEAASDGGSWLDGPAEAEVLTRSIEFSATFVGGNAVQPVGLNEAEARFNYFVGDESSWRSDVPGYEIVAYEGLYDGIDLHTWGQRSSLKYEFHVAPGVDYRQIQIRYEGIEGLTIAEDGSLRVQLGEGWAELVDDAPYIYQEIDGQRVEVAGTFVLVDAFTHSFRLLGGYDPSHVLVIDPELAWMIYLGGSNSDYGLATAVDSAGNILVTGEAWSSGWVSGGWDTSYNLGGDAFVAKLAPSGQHLWSTYLGGSGRDRAFGIAVDGQGSASVTGNTDSTDFPKATNAYMGGQQDAFVAQVSSNGMLQWATYIGGSSYEKADGVAVSGSGNAYITGRTDSANFSGANNAYKGGDTDAFVAKVSSSGSLQWASYLGGSESEDFSLDSMGGGVAVDTSDNVLVTGRTPSTNFTGGSNNGGANNNYKGGASDAFAAKLTSTGSLLWATYLGGSGGDYSLGIAADAFGNIFVSGSASSTNFTGTNNSYKGGGDAFVTKLSPSGSLLWATCLGGTGNDGGLGIAVDAAGNALVTGNTVSSTFSGGSNNGGVNNTYKGGDSDAFAAKLTSTGSLLWATYLGGGGWERGDGIAADAAGNAYVTGWTNSTSFAGASNTYKGGTYDAFVVKLTFGPSLTGVSPNPVPGANGRQWLTIHGNGFGTDFRVTLRDETYGVTYPTITDPSRLQFVNSGEVRVYAGVGTETAIWSVQVTSGGQTTPPLQFNVNSPNGVLRPPALLSPGSWDAPGDVITTSMPLFEWELVPGAEEYGLYISRRMPNGSYELVFDSIAREIWIPGGLSGIHLPGYALDAGGIYRWNMNTRNASGWGVTSPRRYLQYTTTSVPAVPTGLSAEAQGQTAIQVRWNTVSGADQYRLYRADSSDGPWTLQVHFGSNKEFLDQYGQIEGGRTYYYRVAAYNVAGNSALSGTVSVQTPFVAPPPAPSNLTVTAREDGAIALSWLGDLTSGDYVIERADSAGSEFYRIASVPYSQHTFVDTQLRKSTPSMTVRYRIGSADGQSTLVTLSNIVSTALFIGTMPQELLTAAMVGWVAADRSEVARLFSWDWTDHRWLAVTASGVEWDRAKTIILTHGWNGDINLDPFNAESFNEWTEAFAYNFEVGPKSRESDYNLLAVDWSDGHTAWGANPNGVGIGWDLLMNAGGLLDAWMSSYNAILAAGSLAGKLHSAGARPETMTLIGFSNGAGFMGSLTDSLYHLSGKKVKELVALDAPWATLSYGAVLAAAPAAEHVSNYYIPLYQSKLVKQVLGTALDIWQPPSDRLDQNLGFGFAMFFHENITNFELNNRFEPDSWGNMDLKWYEKIDHMKVPHRYAETASVGRPQPWGFATSYSEAGDIYPGGLIWFERSSGSEFGVVLKPSEVVDAVLEGAKQLTAQAWSGARAGGRKIADVAVGGVNFAGRTINATVEKADGGLSWLYGKATDLLPFNAYTLMMPAFAASVDSEAGNSILASIDVEVPDDCGWLSFDLTVVDGGNDDRLWVAMGDEVVGEVDFGQDPLSGSRNAVIWVGDYAGQTGTLHFYVPSAEPRSTEFYIGNIEFYPFNPPLAPVLMGRDEQDDAFRIDVDETGTLARVMENEGTGGEPAHLYALADLEAMTIINPGGQGTFTLDFSRGSPIPPGGIFVRSTEGGTMELIGGGLDATLTLGGRWSELTVGGRTLYFEGIDLGSVTFRDFATLTLALERGTFTLDRDMAGETTALEVSVGEATVLVSTSQHWSALTIGQAGRMSLAPDGGIVLRVDALNMTGDGTLDLGDNGLILESGEWSEVWDWVAAGRNGGDWAGAGLSSSLAGRPENAGRGLVMARNDRGDGTEIVAGAGLGAMIVRFGWEGDGDLNGVVDGDDYFRMDVAFLAGAGGIGDWDFDGAVDGRDYLAVDRAFLVQGVVGEALGAFVESVEVERVAVGVGVRFGEEEIEGDEEEVWEG